MSKKILYIDMDNVLVDFPSGIGQLTPETQKEYEGKLDEVPGIFSLMKPLDGAIDAFNKLSELYDTYILSTAPWENSTAWSDKNEWVKKHLGPAARKRLILSHNKHLNRGDFLIDDRTANGAGLFQGEYIHFGQKNFPDWKSVLAYLVGGEYLSLSAHGDNGAILRQELVTLKVNKGMLVQEKTDRIFYEGRDYVDSRTTIPLRQL